MPSKASGARKDIHTHPSSEDLVDISLTVSFTGISSRRSDCRNGKAEGEIYVIRQLVWFSFGGVAKRRLVFISYIFAFRLDKSISRLHLEYADTRLRWWDWYA